MHKQFTDAENKAFLAALRLLTPVQLLTIIVWLELRDAPDRIAIVQRANQT